MGRQRGMNLVLRNNANQSFCAKSETTTGKSKKLLRLTMPNPADVRQILLAFFMITFFLSSMSLVWTYTVKVPFMRGNSYTNATCSLVGVAGIPKQCQNMSYFSEISVIDGTS